MLFVCLKLNIVCLFAGNFIQIDPQFVIKVNKMKKEGMDINEMLPKFYQKQQEISLKLNPLLKTVRDSNVVSYHQLQEKNAHSKTNNLYHSIDIAFGNNQSTNQQIFHNKPFPGDIFNQSNLSKDNDNKEKKKFEQTDQPYNKSPNLPKKSYFSSIQSCKSKRSSQQKSNFSFNIRSQTSNKEKSKKSSTLVPKTADVNRNAQQIDMQKVNILINNPEQQLSLDDYLSNYIRYKMLTKNPYFTGGKFSKIKKHLVQEINFQEIQKKFYKFSSATTKYERFFQQVMDRHKETPIRKSRFSRNMNNKFYQQDKTTLNKLDKLDKTTQNGRFNFNNSTICQKLQRQKSPSLMHTLSPQNLYSSPQKSRKVSNKARFWTKKSKNNTKQLSPQYFSTMRPYQSTMQVKGQLKSLSLFKECNIRIPFLLKS